jgi:hypothetical protein
MHRWRYIGKGIRTQPTAPKQLAIDLSKFDSIMRLQNNPMMARPEVNTQVYLRTRDREEKFQKSIRIPEGPLSATYFITLFTLVVTL